MNEPSWSIFNVWNDMIVAGEPRELKKRDHIYASEIGGSPIDIYLSMRATEPTNPPNLRSRRKFIAGDFWEWFFVRLMMTAGIFIGTQEHLKHQYPGLLEVTGRLDIFAGGKPDYEQARHNITQGDIAKWFGTDGFGIRLQKTMLAIVDKLEADYKDQELKRIIIEVKSCSSFMFDHYERTNKANSNHVMQLYHYLIAKGLNEGHIFYVCKDDCRVIEFAVFNPSEAEDMYKGFIQEVTHYHIANEQPPLQPMVVFDTDEGRFFKNWKVEYSKYLTMLYGFESPDHYRREWEGQVGSMNRVMKRCVNGEKMTAMNLDVIDKAKATLFPQWDELVVIAKAVAAQGNVPEEGGEDTV